MGSLLVNAVFHSILRGNTFAPMLFVVSDMVCGLFALLCGTLAIFKFIRSQMAVSRERSDALNAIQPIEPSIVQAWRAEPGKPAPRDPAAAAFIASLDQVTDGRPQAWSLDVLRDMEWKRFEEICLAFYRAKGIRAECTPLGPDGGVDVRLYQDEADPAHCTAIVQCKAWGEKYVGVKPVRELRGVMAHEKIDKAFFMAPGVYSDDAKAFAQTNRITLIDGPMFLTMLTRLPTDVSQQLLKQATAGDWTTPTCPSCGTKMLAREGKGYRFWGCRSFPKCRQRLGMRG
ncbi:restriction endonuclease [Uliginosibacterium sp. 31-12]|uniref:restriction endonuclease n=1 Tax=Uliginosibacterium sp. 31-12 TaxID=3062781 RepID=UPI0026E2E522|nr:restriction endonuclease [Uliginosibacterium sp. 31-12]